MAGISNFQTRNKVLKSETGPKNAANMYTNQQKLVGESRTRIEILFTASCKTKTFA